MDVLKGIFQDVARVSDGANHSKSVPAVTDVDVIRVGTESDAEVELFSSPNHYVGVSVFIVIWFYFYVLFVVLCCFIFNFIFSAYNCYADYS